MTDEKSEADKVREHEDSMARIRSRAKAYSKSPFWFTVWDLSTISVKVAFWLGFWSLIAQCTCAGCMW